MSYEAILAELKAEFGKKVLLSPDDIAPWIAKSRDAQQALRKRGTFPIPTTKMGGRIVIKIYDLAKWLSTTPEETVVVYPPTKKPVKQDKPSPFARPYKSRHPGFAKSLMDFSTGLQKQQESLNFSMELYRALETIALQKIVEDEPPKRKAKHPRL